MFFRALNGFLNAGIGGTLYIGILDNGAVRGIHLTQYKVNASIFMYFMVNKVLAQQVCINPVVLF